MDRERRRIHFAGASGGSGGCDAAPPGITMISGVNRVYEHGGKQYHLQAEDLGVEQASFEIRVYDGGSVLWRKRLPYAEILEQKLPKLEQDESLRALMEKTLHTVQAAIAKGKLT